MMRLNSISVIAAIMAIMREKRVNKGEEGSNNSNPLFYLYYKKEKKVFSFYQSKNEDNNNFSLYRLNGENVVTGNLNCFYDFVDKFSYHVTESLNESWNWEVINLTSGKIFGVRFKDGCYRVIDYYIKEVYDFEYFNFAAEPNTIHQDDTKESPIPSNEY